MKIRHGASTLDFGEVAEAAFLDYRFKKKICSFSLTETHISRVAK